MKLTVADYIVEFMADLGCKFVFGIPGSPLLAFYEALYRNSKIKPILVKHEESAAVMADGYARVSGKFGFCCATTGPGTTNLITGLAEALTDGIPLIVLTAHVPLCCYGKGAFQDSSEEGINTAEMLNHVTKYSTVVLSKHRVVDVLNKALITAHTGKGGPVHISVPENIFNETISLPEIHNPLSDFIFGNSFLSHYCSRPLINKAVNSLLHAKKPAIIAGYGAVMADAAEELLELSEKLCIPVATTYRAKGIIPEDHPNYLGSLGFAGSAFADEYIRSPEIDVLLAVGTELDEFTTNCWDPEFQPSQTLIHVDINPQAIGRNYKTGIGLIGHAKAVLLEINLRVLNAIQHGYKPSGENIKTLPDDKARADDVMESEKLESTKIPLLPQRVIKELRESLPKDAIVFSDGSDNLMFAVHYMPFYYLGTFIVGGFGNMAYGTAASVGGRLAAGNQVVAAICGDGGFLMNGMEVSTAVNHNIPVIWVIFNNGILGSIYHIQQLKYEKHFISSKFKPVDFAQVARGLGADGYTVRAPGELGKIIPEIIAGGRPTVIDVYIDPDELPPIKSHIEGKKRFMEKINH